MKKQNKLFRRYYLISLDELSEKLQDGSVTNLSDEVFMTESERQGYVYSEASFEYQFNATDSISANMFLRIIKI